MNIEGMTTYNGLCLMASLMEYAAEYNSMSTGVVEFGTYKGRVSALLGQLKKSEDILHLVDVKNYLETDKMAALGIDYNFYNTKSEDWDLKSAHSSEYWYSHHDASHYFSNVSYELENIAPLMSSHAVIVLDDFADPFNQVRAAYYHQRYAKNNPFELLLMGFGKGVLVKSNVFNQYEDFVLKTLQSNLTELNLPTTLYRTDFCEESRAFSIREKNNDSDPDRYGLHIWGDKFYQVSPF